MEGRTRLLVRLGLGAAGLLLVAWVTPRYGAVYVAGSSMAPAIARGDLAVYRRDSSVLREGDAVLFVEGDGARVVHRVVDIMVDGSVRTRGDANRKADPGRVGSSRVRGVIVAVVPSGRAIDRVLSGLRWCYNHVPIANMRR